MKSSSRVLLALAGLSVAFLLTAASGGIQRLGPELAVYGNLCGPDGNEACYEPRLNGGFPLGYLFDAPGVSVEGKLHLIEDDFRVLPFLGDLALYFGVLSLSWAFGRFRRRLRRQGDLK